jgi:hypothetical protein
MLMGTKHRLASVLVAAGYLLAVSTASLFHHHPAQDGCGCRHVQSSPQEAPADCCRGTSDDHSPRPNAPATPSQSPSDDGGCSVCQFLGQKPAPTADVAPVSSGTLVQAAVLPPPAHVAIGIFSAWHSRGPPPVA